MVKYRRLGSSGSIVMLVILVFDLQCMQMNKPCWAGFNPSACHIYPSLQRGVLVELAVVWFYLVGMSYNWPYCPTFTNDM